MFNLLANSTALAAAAAPSTSFAGVPTLPQAGLPSCPPTWMDLVRPICHTLNVEYALDRCVSAETSQMKQRGIALIMKVMESGPIVANYITFVLAYSKDFKISFVPKRQALNPTTAAHYRPVQRIIEIFDEKPNPKTLEFIRHELRHAYWHTLNQVSLYKELTFSSSNVYPPTVEMRKKVLGYIQAGKQRIENLTELLKKEEAGRLTFKERSELHRLRRVFDINYDLYPYVASSQQGWPLGEIRTVKFFGFHTQMKLLAHIQNTMGSLGSSLSFLDPLAYVVVKVNNIFSACRNYYVEKEYTYEFDAYLYEYLPEQAIREFYPELNDYNLRLEGQVMHSPSPQAMSNGVSPLLSWEEYTRIQTAQILSDEEYFRAYLKYHGNDTIILRIAKHLPSFRDFIAKGQIPDEKSFSVFEENKAILNFHIKNGILVPEAHHLLGRLHYISKGDPKTICMHYGRAFKKIGEVEFDLYDYLDYIDNLLLINNTGEAKIVVQKARAKFLSNPELDKRWAKIKTLQANSNSQPPGKPKVI